MVRISQEIIKPPNDRIFVFGSNMAGRHGKGAALRAKQVYGAEDGVGIGHIGQCYAIPTKDQMLRTLSLKQIEHFVKGFKAYAKLHPNFGFNVTQVGCGLAGYKSFQIAPMFVDAPTNCHFDKAWSEFLPDHHTYWSGPL